MNVSSLNYVYDEIEGINRPTLYPGEKTLSMYQLKIPLQKIDLEIK